MSVTFPALPVTWSLDGVEFNVGLDSFGHSIIVDVPQWDNAPTPKPRFTDRTEGHGAYTGPNYRAGKAMTMRGVGQALNRSAREDLRDRLAALCLDENTLYPLVRNDPHRTQALTMWVQLYDEPALTRRRDGCSLDIDIPLYAPDPWKYSPPNDSVQTGLKTAGIDGILWNGSPAASGGIEWNGSPAVSGGLIYESGAGSSGILRLTNSGTRPAPIEFMITSYVLNPRLVAIQTQQRIRWTGEVIGVNALTINTGTERVTLGSTDQDQINVGAALAENDFFMVPAKGFLDVEFAADSGSGTIASAVNSNVYA